MKLLEHKYNSIIRAEVLIRRRTTSEQVKNLIHDTRMKIMMGPCDPEMVGNAGLTVATTAETLTRIT